VGEGTSLLINRVKGGGGRNIRGRVRERRARREFSRKSPECLEESTKCPTRNYFSSKGQNLFGKNPLSDSIRRGERQKEKNKSQENIGRSYGEAHHTTEERDSIALQKGCNTRGGAYGIGRVERERLILVSLEGGSRA